MKKYTYDQNGTAYQLRGGKHTCPSCGRHTLQLYLNAASGDPINDEVGKCDRHYNCGYDYPPRAFYTDHPEELPAINGRMYARPRQELPKPIIYIPKEYVEKSIIPRPDKGLCGFTDILLLMFSQADVQRVIDTYYLGYTKFGSVIYWQIDEKGLVREGKVMKYDPHTGGRDKASWATGESYWVFSTLQARGVLPTPASSAKCIFGLHLLRYADADTTIIITESEKNAIFGSLVMPEYTWLAVGSSQDIGKLWQIKDTLAKSKSVVVVPDGDAINDWRQRVKELHLPNIKVSNLCAGHAGGWDLADIIRYRYLLHPQTFPATPPPSVEPTPPAITYRAIPLYPEPYDYLGDYTEEELEAIFSPAAVEQWQQTKKRLTTA